MSENEPSGQRGGSSLQRWIPWLAASGAVAVGLLYIIGTQLIKPDARPGSGPAGTAINTGPATVSEAAPGTMHVIPALGARGTGTLPPDVPFLDAEGHKVTLARFRGKVVTERFRMDMVNEWLKVEKAPRTTVFWYALSTSPPPLSPGIVSPHSPDWFLW